MEILDKGWMNVYPAKLKEKKLPDLNGKFKIEEVKIDEKMTQPPKRYTQASLITELEKRNLGTKATRAGIIETLYNRGYIVGESIKATALGMSLIDSLDKHCPIIIDEKLTEKFEKEMNDIQTAKKNLEEKEKKVINEAKSTIEKIADKFKKEEKAIGKELIKANNHMYEEQRKENEFMTCPVCKKGKLRILYNKKFRRYFVACNAYPKCKTTFSLPPNCLVKKAGKTCQGCGFEKLLAIRKGKRPWEFCFNPECSSNNLKKAK